MKGYWFKGVIGVYLLLNGLFIGLEIYKDQLRGQWIQTTTISESAFLELNRLNQWTLAIEFVLMALIAGVGIFLVLTKHDSLGKFIYTTMIVTVIILVTGLAIPLNITSFNLVQQLIGPGFLLICLTAYVFIKKVVGRDTAENRLVKQ